MATTDGGEGLAAAVLWHRLRALLPSVLSVWSVVVAAVLVSPVAWLFLRAGDVSVDRAIALVLQSDTLTIVVNSFVLVTLVTGASILVGVPLAILTVQTDLPFRRFWTVVGALPLVIPSYIGAFALDSAFGSHGVIVDLLSPLGVTWLPAVTGLGGTAVVLTLFTYPYVFLTTRASLISFDGTVIEAARTLNHDRWSAFRRVTLPQIAPGIAAGALLVALYTLSDFGTPQIMGYEVFTQRIFTEHNANRAYAALLSLLLLGMTVVILAVESRLGASSEGAHVSTGTSRSGTIALGRWRYPALAFTGLVAVLGLVVPLGILGLWLFRSGTGYAAGGFPFHWQFAANSVLVAGAAALAAVVLGLPVAYLAARGRSWVASLPERATYVGYAMPGVVLGLALIFLGLEYVPFLYQTIPLLVFAYVVRFIPQAIGIMESSILQVDPSHVEASRSMGDRPLRAFRRVVLPQVSPGVLAGAALVFLTTIKELPATLMLSPPEFYTFVTYIWRVQGSGYYGQAAVPALILVGVSALSMLVILARERYDVTG